MLNHHVSSPFGSFFLDVFPQTSKKQIQGNDGSLEKQDLLVGLNLFLPEIQSFLTNLYHT